MHNYPLFPPPFPKPSPSITHLLASPIPGSADSHLHQAVLHVHLAVWWRNVALWCSSANPHRSSPRPSFRVRPARIFSLRRVKKNNKSTELSLGVPSPFRPLRFGRRPKRRQPALLPTSTMGMFSHTRTMSRCQFGTFWPRPDRASPGSGGGRSLPLVHLAI